MGSTCIGSMAGAITGVAVSPPVGAEEVLSLTITMRAGLGSTCMGSMAGVITGAEVSPLAGAEEVLSSTIMVVEAES